MTTPAPAPIPDRLRHYTPARPLLLVTDYPPDAGGGGAVILRSLLANHPRVAVLWASPSPTPAATLDAPTHPLRSGSAGRGHRRSLLLDSTIYAPALAREVLDLAASSRARALWFVLHGATAPIAACLAATSDLPVHITVHDDPAHANALRSTRYLPLVPVLARDTARALRAARSVDVISAPMRDYYRRRLGIDSTVIHRALAPTPLEPAPTPAPLTVGVLGSTYHYRQLPILARAVALAAAQLGVPGSLVVLGHSHGDRLRRDCGHLLHIEAPGHLDEPAAVARLRRCTALYLNYPFDLRSRVLRRTSFPTKLSTYIQAARPLLVHAPADSSVSHLATDHPGYARNWLTADPRDGARALLALAPADPAALAAAASIRTRYFDASTNRSRLFALLDALVPPLAADA